MKSSHLSVYLNNILVSSTWVHKHLGILLHDKLSYEHHPIFVLNKVKKTIGLLHKFQQSLPRQPLITICKLFIWPHLDYSDIVYDRAFEIKFWIYSIWLSHSDNWSNKRYTSWEAFSKIRLRILKVEKLVKKIMLILQMFFMRSLSRIFFS